MNSYLAQSNFLSAYANYKHSLILPDSDRMAWARQDAADHCKTFYDLCETDPAFAPGIKIAYDFMTRGFHADAPESTPFIPVTEAKPSKPEKPEEQLPWEKKTKAAPKAPTAQSFGEGMSKQQFLAAVSFGSGVTTQKLLVDAMIVARQTMRKENGRFIYTEADVKTAINYLKK